MKATQLLTMTLATTFCVFLGACAKPLGAERANVLLVVVDTLRADHLGSYGYGPKTSPRLDELASRGVRFAGARAASSWTLPSVTSLLTGVYPAVHGVEQSDSVLSDAIETVAQDFQHEGYETAAFSANPAFVTPRQGLARGFDTFTVLHGERTEEKAVDAVPADASLKTWVLEAKADAVSAAAKQWLAQRNNDKPFFLYVHYFDPHAAYSPPEDLARAFGVQPDEPLAGEAQWKFLLAPNSPPADVLVILRKLYDAEIAATDRAIGVLLDALPPTKQASTVIVVTSDHGEEFGEHGGVQHGRTLFEELIHVPLLIAGPGLTPGRVIEAPVSLTALRSTMTELARLHPNRRNEIEPSLLAILTGDPDEAAPIFADLERRFEADRLQHRRALVEGRWKLLVDPERSGQLFDLGSDPGEREALHDEQRLSSMRTRIQTRDGLAVRHRADAPPGRTFLDPAKREQLKALGYLQ